MSNDLHSAWYDFDYSIDYELNVVLTFVRSLKAFNNLY